MKNLTNFFKIGKWNARMFVVLGLTIGLAVFGAIMVYSASSYSALKNYNNKYFFLIKQCIGIAIGAAGMFFFRYFDYQKLRKLKWVVVIVATVLLILVFVPFIGIENYGARRWIGFLGFSIQPSEIAKFALVLFCACHISENPNNMKTLKGILPILLIGGILCVLVILEPNMSITMCLGGTMLVMLMLGGIRAKHFTCLSIPAFAVVPALIFAEPYRLKRLMAFINPWASPRGEGFQLIQSLYSLGAGGWFGVGLFNSRQKYLFLPFSESDFIFSIIGEELGLVGAIAVIICFVSLIIFLIKISLNARDRFGALLSAGVAVVIAIQVFLNIAVVTGSIPPTGLPLPLISAGSTSLMVFMSAIGICLNISSQSCRG